jgi:ABC-type multidrug transport system ATPase subunit
MAEIVLRNVCKRWGSFVGVDDFDLTIADREFLVLLGPSGCGKTTTMRMIAGSRIRPRGEILIGGQGRDPSRSQGPGRGDGVPVLRALSEHERLREHPFPAEGARHRPGHP